MNWNEMKAEAKAGWRDAGAMEPRIRQAIGYARKKSRTGLLYSGSEVWRAATSDQRGTHLLKAMVGAKRGVTSMYTHAFKGFYPFSVAFGGLMAGMSPRHQKASAALSALTPPVFAMAGTLLAGPAGMFLGGVLDASAQNLVQEGIQTMIDTGQQMQRLEMGAENVNTVNTMGAFTMRQRSARAMAGSLMNARQYLGKEAVLLHS